MADEQQGNDGQGRKNPYHMHGPRVDSAVLEQERVVTEIFRNALAVDRKAPSNAVNECIDEITQEIADELPTQLRDCVANFLVD